MPPVTRNQEAHRITTIEDPSSPADQTSTSPKPHGDAVDLHRGQSVRNVLAPSTRSGSSARSDTPDEPPRFTIDLSLPPEQRYLEVCAAFRDEVQSLTSLFDEVVGDMVPFLSLPWLHRICRWFLRRVYCNEENAELRGISKATGVQMYLLVCFNVLLDLFMGCSSGAARVRSGDGSPGETKMLHFRTLDWGMDGLRRIVVQLDFVMERDGPVVARSITYAGFVGVLTGTRENLSMSLNFRPNRIDNGEFWSDAKYAWHLLMVLLGRRPSISTHLREFLLPHKAQTAMWPPFKKNDHTRPPNYAEIIRRVTGSNAASKPITTTACYLCFSDGKETTTVEKDRISAKARSSSDFIVVTNGDQPDEDGNDEASKAVALDAAMQEIITEAKDRQECARNNWSNMRIKKMKKLGRNVSNAGADVNSLMELDDVVQMVQKYPTTNECTHFACVMDPTEGMISWCRRWMKPVSAKWIRSHMSETW